MTRHAVLTALLLLLAMPSAAAAQAPAPESVTLTAPDGARLKATLYAAAKPGPGLLLLHQCNQDRRSWIDLATAAAQRGYHVLAMDFRGFGESEGPRFAAGAEQLRIIAEQWPGDVDAAFAFLTARPGVDRLRVGAAGASCGVNQSVLLASRHPEVRTVLLLSGAVTPAGREYLRRTPSLPVFGAASHGDGDAVANMKWVLGWSANPANRFLEYRAAGHGTEMFAVEQGLAPAMLAWLDAHLRNASTTVPTAASVPASTLLTEFWDVLARPDGRARARAIIEEARRRDPRLVLFPEGEMNLYGYEVLQRGNPEHAIWLFELNVEAYPASANTYDSLSDAYLAAGRNAEALKYAEKTLEALAADRQVTDEFRAAIRASAERKITQLRGK